MALGFSWETVALEGCVSPLMSKFFPLSLAQVLNGLLFKYISSNIYSLISQMINPDDCPQMWNFPLHLKNINQGWATGGPPNISG